MGRIGKININEYQPLREVVFQSLREAIISGELKPGERLMEISLAEQMGVSRTPVREAIRKLELEGLVRMLPRKGAQVANLSVKDIMNVLELRAALDGLATSLAAQRITDEELNALKQVYAQFIAYAKKENFNGTVKKDTEFHDIIYKASRNERLIQIANHLKEQIQRFRVIYLKVAEHSKGVIEEHSEIVHAIEARDGERARRAAEQHIAHQEAGILNTVQTMIESEL